MTVERRVRRSRFAPAVRAFGRATLRRTLGSLTLAVAVLITLAGPAAAEDRRSVDAGPRSVVIAVRALSQLAEPAPLWWKLAGTPYCVAAVTAMTLEAFGEPLPERPLATLFEIGHAANVTRDPGIDPAGAVILFGRFGYAADVRLSATKEQSMRAIVESVDGGTPVIALTRAGDHAVLVRGYSVDEAGDVRELYVIDPLRPDGFRVPIATWLSSAEWMGKAFAAAGAEWQGRYVLVVPRLAAHDDDALGPDLAE